MKTFKQFILKENYEKWYNDIPPWKQSEEEFVKSHYTGYIQSDAYENSEKDDGLDWFGSIDKFPVLVDKKQFGKYMIEFRQTGEKLKYVKNDSNGEIVRDEHRNAVYQSDEEIKQKGLPPYDQTIVAYCIDYNTNKEITYHVKNIPSNILTSLFDEMCAIQKNQPSFMVRLNDRSYTIHEFKHYIEDPKSTLVVDLKEWFPDLYKRYRIDSYMEEINPISDKPIGFVSNEFGAVGCWVIGSFQKMGIGTHLLKLFMDRNKHMKLGQMTVKGIALAKSVHRKYKEESI